MKKIYIFGTIMMLLLTVAVSAGSISITDNEFENGDNTYDGVALIDADTLEGKTYDNISTQISTVLDYVQLRESAYLSDTVGGTGISSFYMRKYIYGPFVDFLRDVFMPRSELEQELKILRYEIDSLKSEKLGVTVDEYQLEIARVKGQYGVWTCYSDNVCFKERMN